MIIMFLIVSRFIPPYESSFLKENNPCHVISARTLKKKNTMMGQPLSSQPHYGSQGHGFSLNFAHS